MKSNPSNSSMNDALEILSNIKKVDPSKDVYAKIERKIRQRKDSVIPINWLRAVAAIFICFASVEIYYVSNDTQVEEDLSQIYYSIDNTLYNE